MGACTLPVRAVVGTKQPARLSELKVVADDQQAVTIKLLNLFSYLLSTYYVLSAEYVLVVVAGEQNQLGPPSGNVGSSGGAGCEKPLKRLLCAGH